MRSIKDIITEGEHQKLMFHPMTWEEFYKAYNDNVKVDGKYDLRTYILPWHINILKERAIDLYPTKFKGDNQYYVIFGNNKSDLNIGDISKTLGDDIYSTGFRGIGKEYKYIQIFSDGFILKTGIDINVTHWVIGMSKEKFQENNIDIGV